VIPHFSFFHPIKAALIQLQTDTLTLMVLFMPATQLVTLVKVPFRTAQAVLET
jgi:hypothetical protein